MARDGPAPRASAALDGLRGMAALMVVASHASGLGMDFVPGLSMAGIGKHGVYLFFAISAYLLTGQWLDATPAQRLRAGHWVHYLLRRVLRIYPLYSLVLVIGWALASKGLGVALDGAAVLRHLLLLEGRGIYWSVPVEFHYYLVIPVLALWLGSAVPATARMLVVLAVLGLVMWTWPSGSAPTNGAALGFYLPVLLCGSLAAWAQRAAPRMPATAAVGQVGDVLLALLLVLSIPSVLGMLGAPADTEILHRRFLAWGLGWGAVLLGLQAGALPRWSWLLSRPALRACGRWCFGLYLLHVPALYVARLLPLPGTLRAWCGLLLALGLASLSYRWIERPALMLAHRFGADQRRP